ncbi:MAG: hypothetical protein HC794_04220 [Nitrospiraceae bacterium]|nr:hypothetical protein [Nitrospiraceae bacterium]
MPSLTVAGGSSPSTISGRTSSCPRHFGQTTRSTTRARIAATAGPAELETIRVAVLGRKGTLAQISKDMGKLAAEQRAHTGRLLNETKQAIEEALAWGPPASPGASRGQRLAHRPGAAVPVGDHDVAVAREAVGRDLEVGAAPAPRTRRAAVRRIR